MYSPKLLFKKFNLKKKKRSIVEKQPKQRCQAVVACDGISFSGAGHRSQLQASCYTVIP